MAQGFVIIEVAERQRIHPLAQKILKRMCATGFTTGITKAAGDPGQQIESFIRSPE
jgi:hypothetical protein